MRPESAQGGACGRARGGPEALLLHLLARGKPRPGRSRTSLGGLSTRRRRALVLPGCRRGSSGRQGLRASVESYSLEQTGAVLRLHGRDTEELLDCSFQPRQPPPKAPLSLAISPLTRHGVSSRQNVIDSRPKSGRSGVVGRRAHEGNRTGKACIGLRNPRVCVDDVLYHFIRSAQQPRLHQFVHSNKAVSKLGAHYRIHLGCPDKLVCCKCARAPQEIRG